MKDKEFYLIQVFKPGFCLTWTITMMFPSSMVPLSKVGCPMSATQSCWQVQIQQQ